MADEFLRIAELVKVPTTDVRALSPTVLRFRFRDERRLDPRNYLSTVIASKQPAVAIGGSLEARVHRELSSALREWTTRRPRHRLWIETEAALVRLTLDHYTRPTWIYTNGRSCISIVDAPTITAASHERFGSYLSFTAAYGRRTFLRPEEVVICSDMHEAEILAYSALARIDVRVVPFTRGDETELGLFRATMPIRSRNKTSMEYFACVRGGVRRVEAQEPYRMLNTLRPDGFRARACGTCRHFQFSGMAREGTGGAGGYCTLKFDARQDSAEPSPVPYTVSVFDLCQHYDFIEDADRHFPYL